MIEINIKSISKETIIAKIENEIKKRTPNQSKLEIPQMIQTNISNRIEPNKLYIIAKKIAIYLRKIGLNKFIYFVKNNLNLKKTNRIYIMSDFTQYYGEEFIDNAYRLILKRDADIEGKKNYLLKLKNGELSREDIILRLYFSKEGRAKDIKILGSKKRLIRIILYKIPIIGYILKLILIFFKLPILLKKIEYYENNTNNKLSKYLIKQQKLEQELNRKSDNKTVKEIKEWIEQELNRKSDNKTVKEIKEWIEQELNRKSDNKTVKEIKEWAEQQLDTKATQKEFELYLKSINYAKEYIKLSSGNLQNLIDEAKKRLPHEKLTPQDLLTIIKEDEHKFDAFYVKFEDKFRGTRIDIKGRLTVYLPYIEKLQFKKDDITLLDVGCGRGEWLELLEENGYHKVKGLDLNSIMVSQSQEFGLAVVQSDVIEYLSSLKDESLSIITGFHIIEHLPFEILMHMFQESLRVLKKGGMVIFETPNPENLLVGSCNFYTDPTHINPIPPTTGEFLLQDIGFVNIRILRLHPLRKAKDIENNNSTIINEIINAYSKEQDYAIIGYKR